MYRLIYKSRIVMPLDWETVHNISHSSEAHNAESGVTGVLLASRTHFLQVLEGRFEDVNAAFRRIILDSRHEGLSLIAFNVIDAKLCSGWGMRGIGIFDYNIDLENELKCKYGEEEGGIRFPLEEWQVLALIDDINMIQDLPEWKK